MVLNLSIIRHLPHIMDILVDLTGAEVVGNMDPRITITRGGIRTACQGLLRVFHGSPWPRWVFPKTTTVLEVQGEVIGQMNLRGLAMGRLK
jgi:hypothetical protein